MFMRVPVSVSPLLDVRIGKSQARLSPRQSLHLAEQLIRTATRRIVAEEVEPQCRDPEKDHE